jgi:hypothetical protein
MDPRRGNISDSGQRRPARAGRVDGKLGLGS